jgi:hypothetical protein
MCNNKQLEKEIYKMVTDNNRKFLSEFTARLAFQDFYAVNGKIKMNKQGLKNFKPYSLSEETQEAQKMYALACHDEHTREEEETIKAYILKAKFRREEMKYKN